MASHEQTHIEHARKPLDKMALTIERVPNLTVMELRKELKTRGEEAKGNKKILVERLTAALEKEAAAEPTPPKRGRGRPPKKQREDQTQASKEENIKEEPKMAEESKTSAATASDGATANRTAKKEVNTIVEADDNPLSDARMKRRAERFGMPWPREENGDGEKSTKRQKLATKTKEPSISSYVLTDAEIKQREARAKRFAEDPRDSKKNDEKKE